MLWLKRNLFLAVGGFLALLLLAGGGYYLWTNKQQNDQVEADLQEKRQALEQIYHNTAQAFPNQTNIAAAKAELEKLRALVQDAKLYFTPIAPPPVSPQEFRILLDNVIYELSQRADRQGIALPGRDYSFSFEAQRKKLTFGPGTFPAMPEQLAQVHALCSILFDAQINKLVSVRRPRISADDEANQGAADYHDLPIQTNALTKCVVTPYMFEFHSFTEELAAIAQNLQQSTNGFVLKSVLVEPLPLAPADPNNPDSARPFTGAPRPGFAAPVPSGRPPRHGARGRPQAPPDPLGQTVLDERLLKIIMLIEIVRCLPEEPKTS